MSHITGIIFSKDRALQLDGTLRSLMARCEDFELLNLRVLYKATSDRHLDQYRQLADTYKGKVELVQERHFRQDLSSIIFGAIERNFLGRIFSFLLPLPWPFSALEKVFFKKTSKHFIVFLVDDTIFVRDFAITTCIQALHNHSQSIGFSLRLGRNTTYCYPKDEPQSTPTFKKYSANILLYHWTNAEHDFGYPLEVSSSIFRADLIFDLLTKIQFKNPNGLEGKMAKKSSEYAKTLPILLCFDQSVAFSNPANRTQDIAKNRFGLDERLSTERLSEAFGEGYRLDVDKYKDFTPNGCHQEVPVYLIQNTQVEHDFE